ncbi:transcriptional regulator, XRE family [Tistlia consotensis]|uniref:Transcriptional regulator, XRE family n=1 Tax=Tistlia consotensis USBA 355 TaxID=560819 RepID=A0A1Y6BF16_9PROT|nr:helix-turn-helix transcriptional regulator [Tistlia consotensis]SME98081.1 transcriptional regulator, XRE family [Tistlia consotensis USBA 355]SNR57483.1 transcriptional regulator, XRE family [Tistlia consotensis]
MVQTGSEERRRELGAFVRARRERLSPAELGLAAGTRRRTPGLRREEVAQLCGLSATWYTWIEQGREVSASPGALARLAGVLRLGRAERAYLFELAGKRDPEPGGVGAEAMPAALPACIAAIAAPAYVLDRCWTARSWNAAAERLFVGWLDRPGERNLLRFIFLEPSARRLISDWPARARRVAAEFRAACSGRLDDPELRPLIAELRRESPEFAAFWGQYGVLEREGGARGFAHPRDGRLDFEQVTFELAGRPDLRLTMLVQLGGAPTGD